MLSFRFFTPSVEASECVSCYWYIETAGENLHTVLADGKSDIVINCGGELVNTENGYVSKRGNASLCTITDKFYSMHINGISRAFGIRVRNDKLANFCAVSFDGLLSNNIDAADIFDKEFYAMLYDAAFLDNADSVAFFCDEAVKKRVSILKKKKTAAFDISTALKLIHVRQGNIKSSELAYKMGISDRTIQREFVKNIGLGAKKYASIVRFNAAIKAIDEYDNLSCLAQYFGYYDHSHLIRDFKKFGNISPSNHEKLSDFYKTLQ